MTEQLQLVPTGPKLTDRQARALTYLQACGPQGATPGDLGRHLGATKYARETGKELGKALAAKGQAKYRRGRGDRPGAWIATSNPETVTASGAAFGEFPEGF